MCCDLTDVNTKNLNIFRRSTPIFHSNYFNAFENMFLFISRGLLSMTFCRESARIESEEVNNQLNKILYQSVYKTIVCFRSINRFSS